MAKNPRVQAGQGASRVIKRLSSTLSTVQKAAGVRQRVLSLLFGGIAAAVPLIYLRAESKITAKVMYQKPVPVRQNEATYILFKDFFLSEWTSCYEGNSKPLDPLPLYRVIPKCQDRALLILPFERLMIRARNKEFARRTTGITKNGSRVLIYGQDFERRKFILLFDGVLVDFHGVVTNMASSCPQLLVTAKSDRFSGRAIGIGFTTLIFNSRSNRYVPSHEEILPNQINEE